MSAYQVGEFYEVPCMYVQPHLLTSWCPSDGWVPILGPKHRDAEHLEFPVEHYHVDWRFIPARAFANARTDKQPPGYELRHILSGTHEPEVLRGEPQLKRRLCKREMPAFPAAQGIREMRRGAWVALEDAYACKKLKPGGICPHRGFDLKQFAQPDGTAICPGHGLRWNLSTGDLVRRHRSAP